MKTCPSCGSDAFSYEMDEECRLVPVCLVCQARGTAVDVDPDTPANPLATAQARSVAAQPNTKQAPPKKTAPFNVLAAAKARVRELNREIARLEKLTVERDQLKRLLAAANQKTGAVLPLRKAQ